MTEENREAQPPRPEGLGTFDPGETPPTPPTPPMSGSLGAFGALGALGALSLPEGDPPLPSPRGSRRSSEDASLSRSFIEVLEQIQVLQERLREIHEQEVIAGVQGVQGDRSRPNQSPKSSKHKTISRLSVKESPHRVDSKSSQFSSDMERRPTARKAEMMIAQKALRTTTDFEETMRSTEVQFFIGVEWDIDDTGLLDLKKNHLAVTSPRTKTHHTGTISSGVGGVARRLRTATDRPVEGCAVNPESRKRIFWDCLAMVALMIEVLTAPLQVYNIDGGFRQVADVLTWVTTAYWVLDVPASFLTAVYINHILHSQLQVVAKVYLKSWFCFDMVMLAPELLFLVNIILQPDSESDPAASGLLRALRARRLVRVIRFARIMRFRKAMTLVKKLSCYKQFRMFFQGWISASLLPLVLLLLLLSISVHFLASLWFVAGDVEGGWVMAEGLHDAAFVQQYVRSVEWALSRLPASSLRSNVELNTAFERWLAIMATFVSLCISSLFISVLTNIMADVARKTRKMTQILESVRKYCGTCGVSLAHTMKIRRLVEREHFRANIQDHMQFLLSLPESLVRELFHEARSLTLGCHPFFLEIGAANASMELHLCNQAVKELYLLEHDVIFYGNQKGQGLYILASGAAVYAPGSEFHQPQSDILQHHNYRRRDSFSKVLNIFGSSGDHVESTSSVVRQTSLMSGKPEVYVAAEEFVSEQALWIRGWKHQGRLEATVESRAILLAKVEMRVVLQDYADILATAVIYARSFVSAMNEISAANISDMPLDPSLLHLDPANSSSLGPKGKGRYDKVLPGQ